MRSMQEQLANVESENLELLRQNSALSEVSARDTLTGLYNRWYVMEKIDSEMNRALRHGSPVSVLMIDIDHFKRVNDTFGHSAGDQVLQSVGKMLRESCRVYDVPGRYGGEEFCVVLPETRVGNTTVVAERIRERLEASRFDRRAIGRRHRIDRHRRHRLAPEMEYSAPPILIDAPIARSTPRNASAATESRCGTPECRAPSLLH